MSSPSKCWKRLASEANGAEIAEFAAILPVLIMLLLGIMSFARAYNVYTTITYAAQEGARTAVASTCADCGNIAATSLNVASRVTQVLQASHIDPNIIQAYSPPAPNFCTGGSCSAAPNGVTVCTNVELNAPAATGPQACGATVSFKYPFQFNLPFTSVSKQVVTLKAEGEMPSED
jgi:Flp pilus assembly protein TadG